jgi:hypothetical protein
MKTHKKNKLTVYNIGVMDEVGYPRNIDELELYFDEALSKLRIYKLPLYLALQVALVIYEELHCTVTRRISQRFSAEAAMLHYKCALGILIPQLFKRCGLQKSTQDPLTVTQSIVDTVTDAIQFCERYDSVIHCYTLYHQNYFTGSLNNRIVDFQYAGGINLGRSSLNLLLDRYHEQRAIKGFESFEISPLSFHTSESNNTLVKQIRFTSANTVFHSIPKEIYVTIRKIVETTVPRPAVDSNANCGSYSIGDSYNLWLEFITQMLAYREVCEEKSRIDSSFNLLNHRILQITLPELSGILAKKGAIEYKVALKILSDLVLDTTALRPDILIQPLIPILNTEKVLIAPSLIYTANWEICTLRNWTRLYQDVYGQVIASKKTELAKSLANPLGSGRFIISINRKLTDGKGRTIGDVDVAAFDPSDGLLVIFEVKWLIGPDSVRETIKSDMEIAHGIEQILRCSHEFEKDRSRFLKQIFPSHNIDTSEVSELKCYVISHGNVGSKDDEENEVYVLDYLLSIDIIANSSGQSLRQILRRIVNSQTEISNSIDKRARPKRIKLAGYLIRLPGYGAYTIPNIGKTSRAKQRSRNDPCICGSGKKYKKCCLELDGLAEDVF